MAVQNSLKKAEPKKEQGVQYEVNGLQVTLTPETVRNYLVSGDKERVTIQEVAMFINLCKFSKLNPWLKEAYCIKYGSEPATMVVGKDAFMKRAEANATYDGIESGVIVIDDDGSLQYRNGSFYLPGDTIVGGYAEVWRKDKSHSYRVEVSFDEYAARKKDGSLNSQWSKKPATMIRKVAQVQALREAFPNSLSGIYTAEEQGLAEPIDNTPIEQPMQQEAITEQAEPQTEPTQEVMEGQMKFDMPNKAPQDAQTALFGSKQ